MSSALGDKKGRVADSSDLTRLQRESAVLAAYTTYTGLSVNKKANQQLGNDRRFTLGRGGLTLKADSTTGITRNPINGKVVLPPNTPPIYGGPPFQYAIPDFSTATVVSDGNPYIVSSGEQQYSVYVSTALGDEYTAFGGQKALIRTTAENTGWVSSAVYFDDGTTDTAQSLTVTAPGPFLMLAYSLASGFGATNSPVSWTVSGSTDGGETFTTIDTQTDQELGDLTAIYTYSLPSNTTTYTVYKLTVNSIQPDTGAHALAIRQFNLLSGVVVSE
jgi:hypothetical protein